MNYRSIAALLFLLFAAFAIQAQKIDKNEEALRKVINQMTGAQAAYDSATLDRIYTADFIEISPVGEYDPREKVLSFYNAAEKAKSSGININIEEKYRSIRFYGDTAVAIAELAYLISKDGNQMPPRKMMITLVAHKANGTWKIASVHYTGIRPPTSTAAKPN